MSKYNKFKITFYFLGILSVALISFTGGYFFSQKKIKQYEYCKTLEVYPKETPVTGFILMFFHIFCYLKKIRIIRC